MGDPEYEKEYLARKKKLRDVHKNLKDRKHIQEIYHKIMGSNTEEAGENPEGVEDELGLEGEAELIEEEDY